MKIQSGPLFMVRYVCVKPYVESKYGEAELGSDCHSGGHPRNLILNRLLPLPTQHSLLYVINSPVIYILLFLEN